MEDGDKLYPVAVEDYNELNNKQRITIIKAKVESMNKELIHYKKIRKRWSKASNIVRLIGLTTGSFLGTASLIIGGLGTGGLVIPVFIPIVIGSLGVLEVAISEGAVMTYCKKRKHYFNEKVNHIENYINKLYHFSNKAIEDRKVTTEEMTEYYNLIKEYESGVSQD